LQEVAPPAAVQQVQAALAERQPQVSIQIPRDGSDLPAGPIKLQVQVRDWPLVDAGVLGLGPHLVVQVDDLPPQRLTTSRSGQFPTRLDAELPPLGPGSHRLTAYAAKPWGEAVKSPGAWDQVRVNRVAANPLATPQLGTPQLIGVSTADLAGREPVLLDWLLIDAPLQGLRDNDGSWRLRVTVNGDSFLVDQNSPLWLKGWQSGSNSVLMELVDGRGAPLNPPFNTLVSEVTINSSSPTPSWQRGRLEASELAQLLGEQPVTPTDPEPKPEPEPEPVPEAPVEAIGINPPPASEPQIVAEPLPATEPQSPLEAEALPEPEPLPEPEQLPDPEQLAEIEPAVEAELAEPARQDAPQAESAPVTPPQADPAPTTAPTPAPTSRGPTDRLSTSTSLGGSARSQLNPDGSLLKPKAQGPLAGLRQKLGT
jgi:outer membrane biosynthesis protein TonB